MNLSEIHALVSKIVPEDDLDEFWEFFSSGLNPRIRTTYLTWKHNKKVKEKAAASKPPPSPPPLGKGKASDWRDVAQGIKSVE